MNYLESEQVQMALKEKDDLINEYDETIKVYREYRELSDSVIEQSQINIELLQSNIDKLEASNKLKDELIKALKVKIDHLTEATMTSDPATDYQMD